MAAIVVIFIGLKLAQDLVVPILVGMLVAVVASPIVAFLLHKHVPPLLVAVIALGINLVVVVGFGVVLVVAANDLQAFIPRYTQALDHADVALSHWLTRHGASGVDHPLPEVLRGAGLVTALTHAANSVLSAASSAAIVLLVAFFTLGEVTLLGDKLRALVPNASTHFARLNAIIQQVQRYLLVKVFVAALAGATSYLVLRIFHVDLALLLSVIVFLLHFIPNVGPLLALIPAVVVALLTRGVATGVGVGVSLQTIAIVCGNVVEPRLLGRTLGLSPLTVLLAMLFWGWLWGPIGAVLAVPLTSVVHIVLENSKGLEWVARMLETAPDLSPSAGTPHITQHPFLRRPTYIIGGK
jgi:predicted PurR-regulated permease PerM